MHSSCKPLPLPPPPPIPDSIPLIYVLLPVLVPLDLLFQIPIRTELHDNAQLLQVGLNKGLIPPNEPGVLERSEDADLIKGIFEVLFWGGRGGREGRCVRGMKLLSHTIK